MNNKNFIKIINEEISNFDFLGNDEKSKEFEIIDLLKNEDFQKQFICDSLVKKNKIKIDVFDSKISGNWDDENASKLIIEFYTKIEYKFDQNKDTIKFELNFYGDNVSIDKSSWNDIGDRHVAPTGNQWFSEFNWNDIIVNLNTIDGDEIDFIAFKKAPYKIKALFIREFTEDFITNYTNMEIRTPEMKDSVQNIPYC